MSADKQTIDNYSSYAKQWAERLRSGNNLGHEYLEKPAMYQRLPDLNGKTVLCIGCGTGEECDYIQSLGAQHVVGIDLAPGLIAYAQESYPSLDFRIMDVEQLALPDAHFDYVYSSLTLNYLEEWSVALREIYRVMKPGATFLFSNAHPVKWGAETLRTEEKKSFLMGYEKYTDGGHHIYGDYLTTRKITDVWFNELEVSYYHRSLEAMMQDLLGSGLLLKTLLEPKALSASQAKDPDFFAIHQKIPLFIIFELVKPL